VANSYAAPLEKYFKLDANGAHAFVGHILSGVKTVKCFVNVQLHCNVSNLKKISKNDDVAPTLEKFLQTPMAAFTLSASFDVWSSQAKLAMYEIGK